MFAALSAANPAYAQCPFPLPCDAAPTDHIACLGSNYSFFEDPQDNHVREQDQTSEGLARVVSIRPRVSGSSEAGAGYLALRADSTIVALPPGINRAEMLIEGYWRRSVVIQSASQPVGFGTMIGLFSWRGGIEQIAVPLTEEAGVPLNGAHAAAMLQIGALDETCYPVAEIIRTDSSCSGRRVLEVPPCSGDAFVDEIVQVEVPFTFGRPFHLFGYARLDADVGNLDSALADEFFGGARADFGSTGRWMGILEVRDILGAPIVDYTVRDLANPAIDWTQPVPEPGPGASIATALVALCLLQESRRGRRDVLAALGLATLLLAAPARARVQLSTPRGIAGPSAAQTLTALTGTLLLRRQGRSRRTALGWLAFGAGCLSTLTATASAFVTFDPDATADIRAEYRYDLAANDQTSPECGDAPGCLEAITVHDLFVPLLATPSYSISESVAVPIAVADLDLSHALAWSFDPPGSEFLTGGSLEIQGESRSVFAPIDPELSASASADGTVTLRLDFLVSEFVTAHIEGQSVVSGAQPGIFGSSVVRPYVALTSATCCQTFFLYEATSETEIGPFDSGDLLLAPGRYVLYFKAGAASGVGGGLEPLPETVVMSEGLSAQISFVPEPEAPLLALAMVATLAALRPRSAAIAIVLLALGPAPALAQTGPAAIERPDRSRYGLWGTTLGWDADEDTCPEGACFLRSEDRVSHGVDGGPAELVLDAHLPGLARAAVDSSSTLGYAFLGPNFSGGGGAISVEGTVSTYPGERFGGLETYARDRLCFDFDQRFQHDRNARRMREAGQSLRYIAGLLGVGKDAISTALRAA